MKPKKLAKALAFTLADEVTYHGKDNVSEQSLLLLDIAKRELGISKEINEILAHSNISKSRYLEND